MSKRRGWDRAAGRPRPAANGTVLTDLVGADRIPGQQQAIAKDLELGPAAPGEDIVGDVHCAMFEVQPPDPTCRPVIGAAPARPPLRCRGIDLDIDAIDGALGRKLSSLTPATCQGKEGQDDQRQRALDPAW
jgi:hypothetical protein